MSARPLSDWIHWAKDSLPKDEYYECGVKLALQLTKRLAATHAPFSNDSSGSSSPTTAGVLTIEDVIPANIFVTRTNSGTTEINTYVTTKKSNNYSRAESNSRNHHHPPRPPTQSQLCFALGKILFEIFSQGDSYQLLLQLKYNESNKSKNRTDENNDVCGIMFDDLLVGGPDNSVSTDGDSTSNRSKKSRRTTMDTNSSAGTTAMYVQSNVYLEELGSPRSICRLVADLLQAGEEDSRLITKTALLSLQEVEFDLTQMTTHPQHFLRDNTGPNITTGGVVLSLFGETDGVELYGREREINFLMEKAMWIYLHSPMAHSLTVDGSMQVLNTDNFLCEVILLSGYSGSGKSSILRRVTSYLLVNGWFLLQCKFDRQVAPLLLLVQSVDKFLEQFVIQGNVSRVPETQDAFDRISLCIVSSIDRDSFAQLCELLPNFRRLFPMSAEYIGFSDHSSTNTSTPGGLGFGSNRLKYLFQLILRALCGGGRPVSYIFDDLQWADAFTMEIIRDIIHPDGSFSSEENVRNRGVLLLGSFRKDELDEKLLIDQLKSTGQTNTNINFSSIYVDELPEREINVMLSSKFYIPMRYTKDLARIIYKKSRGHPLYIVEFLRSIVTNNMIYYSVRDRRWVWDEITIDLQMISEGVVELLTRKLRQLSPNVIETLQVISCFGQVNIDTLKLLDMGQLVPDIFEALELATREGIVERAGPIFAFTHDLLQESTLALIPDYLRHRIRKKIGLSLVQGNDEIANNSELCILAVDQINACKDVDGLLTDGEKELFAQLNLAAGKHSIAALSYEQARGHFEAGISLLCRHNPWERQYSLCLELFEMLNGVNFMDGKVDTMSIRFDSILLNARSFDDTLKTRSLRAKFMASQGQYSTAIAESLEVILKFGVELPQDVNLSQLKSEVSVIQALLKDTSKETILNLPPMHDDNKLHAMKFVCDIVTITFFPSPMLMAMYCCRMIQITLEYGFCEETISSVAYASYAIFHYGEDIEMATRLTRIAESLISGHPNEHELRAKLSGCICSVTSFVEPSQALIERCLMNYNSAQIIGDVDNAMLSSLYYCLTYIYCLSDLAGAQIKMRYFLQQSVKHKRKAILHSLMCLTCILEGLLGCTIDIGVNIMNENELLATAEKTNNVFLMQQIIIGQMYLACYFQNFTSVVELGKKYRTQTQAQWNMGVRRPLDVYRVFFEGISALCLARKTNNRELREIGIQSVKTMNQLLECSEWNFRNKLDLLNAELHYLNGDNILAEISFQDAILSAHEHRFYHEEALTCEFYGVFLIETEKVNSGIEQLQMARDLYLHWGAKRKADTVTDFILSHSLSGVAMRLISSEDDNTIKSHALLPRPRNGVCCGSAAAGLGCICEK